MRHVLALIALAACGGGAERRVTTVKPAGGTDPQGSHRAAVAAHVQPMIDAEIATAVVVGLYDAGKLEIYGFGKGPGGAPPTGSTIFELGAITRVYSGLLLADAVQRKQVTLETPAAELLPPGVTLPTANNRVITLQHLAHHSSGLPPLPPSVVARANAADPLAGYDEERLYADLLQTQLVASPGERITLSDYGAGLLGHLLGRKLGSSFQDAVQTRILTPLGLTDTYFFLPPSAAPRRLSGTTLDLQPVTPWSWGALVAAGGIMSTVRDQLRLIDAELDAASGSKQTLRPAMRFTQEAQLAGTGANIGLGWQIDKDGRHWHNGTTNGHHAFMSFDVKERRGVVILAATASPMIDQVSFRLYQILAGEDVKPQAMPTPAQLATYAGTYDFGGVKLQMIADGKRLYVEGPGEPRMRMLPISATEFWITSLQSIVVFQEDAGKVARAVFVVGDKQMVAPKQ